jgi:hypothetical protein
VDILFLRVYVPPWIGELSMAKMIGHPRIGHGGLKKIESRRFAGLHAALLDGATGTRLQRA